MKHASARSASTSTRAERPDVAGDQTHSSHTPDVSPSQSEAFPAVEGCLDDDDEGREEWRRSVLAEAAIANDSHTAPRSQLPRQPAPQPFIEPHNLTEALALARHGLSVVRVCGGA